ncbi:hypothetical protein Rhe02_15000 [Rhizocola hellebori]|uniref:Uncharacterized protein n=1 Tax=Rhizocola hellebori TaxID=1392758 RepID=A0A8J3VEY8_9ACTN|nr:hypothetical protein Rhe02_15000 [Rhizocola hellebori]
MHRLVATGKVDHSQPGVPERGTTACADPATGTVRSAVGQTPHCRGDIDLRLASGR